MKKRLTIFLGGIAALAIAWAGLSGGDLLARDRFVHTESSDYAPIVVFEEHGERCMNFNEIEGQGRQTCIRLDNPKQMVFEYTRMMMASLFVNPQPESVLIIGLGGGTLPMALHALLPETTIDTVELDPAVVRVAERFFGYQTGPRQRVFVEDGRAFVERAVKEGRGYDMVMLDAFDVDYIPAHLLTIEFLEEVRELLAPGGVVVANSFAQSSMYERESATYAAVFGEFFNLRAGLEGNRVIIATPGSLPDKAVLEQNAGSLDKALQPYGIETQRLLDAFAVHHQAPGTVQPLRDPVRP